jgi:hypothetical protein
MDNKKTAREDGRNVIRTLDSQRKEAKRNIKMAKILTAINISLIVVQLLLCLLRWR